MPVYYIPSDAVDGDRIRIEGALLKHLRDALRVRSGERVTLVDEMRRRYLVRFESVGRSALSAVIEERRGPEEPDSLRIILGQSMIKGDRMESIIQKATELGVSKIVPLLTERTVVRPFGERLSRRRVRFQSIAVEAAQQSGRSSPPEIERPTALGDFLSIRGDAGLALFFYEKAADSRHPDLSNSPILKGLRGILRSGRRESSVAIAIGPEGGFTPDEAETAESMGWELVNLGRRILRSDTAPLAILSILQFEWGGLEPGDPTVEGDERNGT